MHCPFCECEDTHVKDSRSSEDGSAIRRRRMCPKCGSRFTTFERVQLRDLTVVKKDGRRKPFDRDKLIRSIELAVRKRAVDESQIERLASTVTRTLEKSGESEVTSKQIGEAVMEQLATLDPVAYVRFASVYKDFRGTDDFERFIQGLGSKL